MKLVVLNWLKDSSINLIGRTIELIFRGILLILPLGVYLLLIQAREKASTVSNISVYTTDDSRWQHIFPGFILVAIDPKIFKKKVNKLKNSIQLWISSNKYLIGTIFMLILIAFLYIGVVK